MSIPLHQEWMSFCRKTCYMRHERKSFYFVSLFKNSSNAMRVWVCDKEQVALVIVRNRFHCFCIMIMTLVQGPVPVLVMLMSSFYPTTLSCINCITIICIMQLLPWFALMVRMVRLFITDIYHSGRDIQADNKIHWFNSLFRSLLVWLLLSAQCIVKLRMARVILFKCFCFMK